jgi:dipeptidyl aminopeptidase/acylaminoacyl peptidase
MKNKISIVAIAFLFCHQLFSQKLLTPEALWSLGRISPLGISKDGSKILYRVSTPNIEQNKSDKKTYSINFDGSGLTELQTIDGMLADKTISPNGKLQLYSQEVKIQKVFGQDFYPEMKKSDVQIYNSLNYRHWDAYNEGKYNHVFIKDLTNSNAAHEDILDGSPFDCPQRPFGGDEDFVWSPDGKKVIYVTKKSSGTAYATSTNSDLFEYDLASKTTINLTINNLGYDQNPVFSPKGELAWLQMKRDGYEADKQDIIFRSKGININLTANWDGTVNSFVWDSEGSKIYFLAANNGTMQVFSIENLRAGSPKINQLTSGDFDVNDIIDIRNNEIFVTRCSFHHANEIFSYNLKTKAWKQLTDINRATYNSISKTTSVRRWVTTKDGKKMLVWVVFPPNFDKTKQYPTLLYCQGGPQSALTQMHSFRWNLGLMASQGYIVVAPNRRGMPGHGVQWNEEISKDWGGKPMEDYLSAIDEISNETYVDKTRRAAVGASYGGYSVFYLAGIHENRFKTFISHCGLFNLESFYGTTEEVFFANWDIGGPYWDNENVTIQRSYQKFNPQKLVSNWNTPILIFQGAKDYRVPIGQGQEAFQAAQLKGLKSKFILFNDENHWISKPQNALIWQREFFKWLKETL